MGFVMLPAALKMQKSTPLIPLTCLGTAEVQDAVIPQTLIAYSQTADLNELVVSHLLWLTVRGIS